MNNIYVKVLGIPVPVSVYALLAKIPGLERWLIQRDLRRVRRYMRNGMRRKIKQ